VAWKLRRRFPVDPGDAVTPHQIELVQKSFQKVVPIAGTAADLFYDRLFEIAPEVRSLFPQDLTEQKKKLMTMLGTAVTNLHKLDTILPAVQDLGRRHKGYGVTSAHYEPVGAALLWTLEKGLGPDFTPEVKAAWTETYTALASVMIAA
jgi:hemoglobin-like flavoprotein